LQTTSDNLEFLLDAKRRTIHFLLTPTKRSRALVFAAIGIFALIEVFMGARGKRDGFPFAMTVLFFLSAFLTLGALFWPYIIPYRITVGNAAAPDASLSFLFYGAVVILPLVTVYTMRVYWIFRGKIRKSFS
jgi:cytochrome d ubiquinol oxidase subunit II